MTQKQAKTLGIVLGAVGTLLIIVCLPLAILIAFGGFAAMPVYGKAFPKHSSRYFD